MKKGVRVLIILVVVFAVVGAAGYFGVTRFLQTDGDGPALKFPSFGARASARPGAEEQKYSVPVAVSAARLNASRETLILYGSVFAEKEVSIFTTVNGKVMELRVEEGDVVQDDQVLALIDRDQAGLKFAPVAVESTISGVVKQILTQEGATVNPTAPLFQIVDMDVVEAVVDVPEKEIGSVRIGQPVEIAVVSYPGRIFRGSIDRLSPVVDPASRTMETRIRVANSSYQLKPGMFAEAKIVLRQRPDAVTIPLSSLIEKEGEQVVFVLEQDKVRKVVPEIAFVDGETVVVDSGISNGDRVVVIGQQSLNDGDEVTVAEERE